MKTICTLLLTGLLALSATAQKLVSFSFVNDYPDVYRLALLVFTPDGKNVVRTGNLNPGQIKWYQFAAGSSIYLADYKQEDFAMKGNDIRKTGVAPFLVLHGSDEGRIIPVSQQKTGVNPYEAVVRRFAKDQNFSGTVLVGDNGKTVYQQSVGLANRADRIALHDGYKYRIASLTKTFTAVLILQLMEQGKIDLKNTIGAYLPAYTGAARDKATIHHLLTYSSGMENQDQNNEAMYALQLPVDTIIKKYCSGTLVHEPGKRMDYKNAEYILLGKIIEAVTGKPYETVLQENILTPLQMKRSGYLRHKDIVQDLATSYLADSTGQFYNDDPYWIENFYSSGSMYSTAGDLYSFDQALFTNKLLKKATVDLMTTSYPELWNVAYSFWVNEQKIGNINTRVMDRRGSISGSNAAWYHLIGRNQTIIVLSNSNAADVVALREALAEVVVK